MEILFLSLITITQLIVTFYLFKLTRIDQKDWDKLEELIILYQMKYKKEEE